MLTNYVEKVQQRVDFPVPDFPLNGEIHRFGKKKNVWAVGHHFPYKSETFWIVIFGDWSNPTVNGRIKSWKEDGSETKYFTKIAKQKQNEISQKVAIEIEKRQTQCKINSEKKINKLQKVKTHPYLTKKKIDEAETIFQEPNEFDETKMNLAIPAFDKEGLTGFQYINENGKKWYSEGIKIKGSIHNLRPFKKAGIVYLCEGFATACSIQFCVDAPVICCFSANNIGNAIRTIRFFNPGCFIRICADNDKIADKLGYRTGKHYAEMAVLSDYKTSAVYPYEDEETIGDFNDLFCNEGWESVVERLKINEKHLVKSYERRIKGTGFSSFNEKGILKRENELLWDYFNFKYNYFYVSETKKLFTFNGTHYIEMDDAVVKSFAQENFYPVCQNEKHRMEFLNFVRAKNVKSNFKFKRNSGLINFKNGILDYNTGEFLKHSHEFYFDYVIPHNYEPDADCPIFDKMLSNLMLGRKEEMNVIGEFMGFILSAEDYSKYQKFMIFSGSGFNGKSTLIEIIEKMIGKQNSEAISIGEIGQNRFLSSSLEYCLLNVSEEENKKCFQDTGAIKKLTGNSPITMEQKNKPAYSTRNYAKFLISYNEMPYLNDISKGMLRRMIIVPFDADLEESPELKVDLSKIEKELPGIINFALRGLKRLKKNKDFTKTKSNSEQIGLLIKENNSMVEFVQECVKIDSGAFTPTKNVFNSYTSYTGDYQLNEVHFARKFKKTLNYLHKNNDVGTTRRFASRGFTGISLTH